MSGSILRFDKALEEEHKLFLLKNSLSIPAEYIRSLGPLQEPPLKYPKVPHFVMKERLTTDSDAYVLIKRDSQGETKLNQNGSPIGSRNFLFTSFSFPKGPSTMYALVRDVMAALGISSGVENFFEQNSSLYPNKLSADQEEFLRAHKVLDHVAPDERYFVTTRSVFMLFGAQVIVAGTRVVDDYWELSAREQGFGPHHRVFSVPQKILTLVKALSMNSDVTKPEEVQASSGMVWENPLLTVSEQPSEDLRNEYGKAFWGGEHLAMIVAGQNISGSVELSAHYKMPKYHSRTISQLASQNGAQDTPIGELAPTNLVTVGASETVSKSSKRLLNEILEPSSETRFAKGGITQALIPDDHHDASLNINGFKFDALPLKISGNKDQSYSLRGLPLYDKNKLQRRLLRLTPNQVVTLEHEHDAVFLTTGLQSAREGRSIRWRKYWQHKAGLPVGLRRKDETKALKDFFDEELSKVDKEISYNDMRQMEEVRTTKRVPNANFLGHSNITGLKPPYVNNN
ncbi:LAMI_0G17634g1_1 [Lachancea mirantina]|uniref:LAMI_0G17634g1_1 n=1 Tax=Lachancea mirantina TaxID=1230905 RepID=A0A1G4KCU8_9SACH|nr:LAMI_0G17634g1_1 [Lachancea mirantina]